MSERSEGAKALAEKHLPGLPERVTDKVFEYAWEEGHASGWNEVEYVYQEVAAIAEVAYEMGRKRELGTT